MVELPRAIYDQIIGHALEGWPNEICGLIAGNDDGQAVSIYRIRNSAETPRTFYDMDPTEQFQAMVDMEDKGLQLYGIYHSHPHSQAYPSHTDRELAFYPDAIYMICSLEDKENPVLRGFHIKNHEQVQEQDIRVVDQKPGAEQAPSCC